MSNNNHLKKIKLKIQGMHCASCEVLIERRFKAIPGVEKVHVNQASGKADVTCSKIPAIKEFDNAIEKDGYRVIGEIDSSKDGKSDAQSSRDRLTAQVQGELKNQPKDYAQMGVIFLFVVALYILLTQLQLIPEGFGVKERMSYGFIFLIGLVAAVSTCIAVTGGLLLAVTAKYNEKQQAASVQGAPLTPIQKMKPHLMFNVGRVLSYTIFGGLIGGIGSAITLSPRGNGILTIIASVVMVILGLRLLKLFPGLAKFQPKMPKALAHKIHDMQDGDHPWIPFMMGGATFFLPCGFTQALQLYVLSKGDAVTGALTMLVFALGTLPALMSLGALSSFIKGAFQNYFLKFAGIVVILVGAFSFNNGLALSGVNTAIQNAIQNSQSQSSTSGSADLAELKEGKQIVSMRIDGYDYEPSQFTVRAGVPVEWHIDGTQAAGCAQVVVMPGMNITEYLPRQGEKVVTFTPTKVGKLPFSCSMGMTTPGAAFTVVENGAEVNTATDTATGDVPAETPQIDSSQTDAPQTVDASRIQKFTMEISNEKGVDPSVFAVKKGVPVELTIDSKVALGGCMGIFVIPDYDVTQAVKKGISVMKFTPTKTGTSELTCSMGSYIAEFTVTE